MNQYQSTCLNEEQNHEKTYQQGLVVLILNNCIQFWLDKNNESINISFSRA
jgi:hypothetical protein